jgi:hypothetical protein
VGCGCVDLRACVCVHVCDCVHMYVCADVFHVYARCVSGVRQVRQGFGNKHTHTHTHTHTHKETTNIVCVSCSGDERSEAGQALSGGTPPQPLPHRSFGTVYCTGGLGKLLLWMVGAL